MSLSAHLWTWTCSDGSYAISWVITSIINRPFNITALCVVGHSFMRCRSQFYVLWVTVLCVVGHSFMCCWSQFNVLLVTVLCVVGHSFVRCWSQVLCVVGDSFMRCWSQFYVLLGHSFMCCWSQFYVLLVTVLCVVGHCFTCCWPQFYFCQLLRLLVNTDSLLDKQTRFTTSLTSKYLLGPLRTGHLHSEAHGFKQCIRSLQIIMHMYS